MTEIETRYLGDVVLRKTFHLIRLSLLHKFPTSTASSSVWKALNNSLVAAVKSNYSLSHNEEILVNVRPAEDETDCQVSTHYFEPIIFSIVIRKTDTDEIATRLNGVLFSHYLKANYKGPPEGFSVYPLLLLKGSKKLAVPFLVWLQKKYDCNSSPLILTPRYLYQLAQIWTNLGNENEMDQPPFELTYAIPSALGGNLVTNLKLTIPSQCVLNLNEQLKRGVIKQAVDGRTIIAQHNAKSKKSIAEKEIRESREINTENQGNLISGSYGVGFFNDAVQRSDADQENHDTITLLVNAIASHVFKVSKIDIRGLNLTKVGTAVSFASGDGRLKLYELPYVLNVLSDLSFVATRHNEGYE